MNCLFCDEEILDGEDLSPLSFFDIEGNAQKAHIECSLRSVLGGYGHHINHEYWCLKMGDPDAEMSYRDSSRMVYERYQTMSAREFWRSTDEHR